MSAFRAATSRRAVRPLCGWAGWAKPHALFIPGEQISVNLRGSTGLPSKGESLLASTVTPIVQEISPVRSLKRTAATLVIGIGAAGVASAGEVLVSSDIATSTTWTANNTYNLQEQIYVLPGATLTIQAGTIIASTTDIGGSLAVCNGAQIFALGTKQNPIVFTSTDDVATWVGGNPKKGVWREGANEWGNLTLMGDAFISESSAAIPGN